MALVDEVQDRYSEQYIRNITNPDNSSPSTFDAARLAAAAADAEAEFGFWTGVPFDLTDQMHINYAVEGVIVILKEKKSARNEDTKKAREEWEKKLKEYAVRAGAESRFNPRTTGIGEPSNEQVGTEIVRPKFDDRKFEDLNPDDPKAGQSVDNPT